MGASCRSTWTTLYTLVLPASVFPRHVRVELRRSNQRVPETG